MEIKIWINEFELTKEDPEVEFTGNPAWVDNGIGSYEYWGQKCNDVQWGVDCEDANWDHAKYTDEENKIIDQYLHKAIDEFCDRYSKECDNKDRDCGPDEDDLEPLNYMEDEHY
jgi:hypothetical protein